MESISLTHRQLLSRVKLLITIA